MGEIRNRISPIVSPTSHGYRRTSRPISDTVFLWIMTYYSPVNVPDSPCELAAAAAGAGAACGTRAESGCTDSVSGPPKTILPLWLAFLRASASAWAEAWRDPTSRNSSTRILHCPRQETLEVRLPHLQCTFSMVVCRDPTVTVTMVTGWHSTLCTNRMSSSVNMAYNSFKLLASSS